MREFDKPFKRHSLTQTHDREFEHYERIVVRSKSSIITLVSSVLFRLPAAQTKAESVHLIRQTTPKRRRRKTMMKI